VVPANEAQPRCCLQLLGLVFFGESRPQSFVSIRCCCWRGVLALGLKGLRSIHRPARA